MRFKIVDNKLFWSQICWFGIFYEYIKINKQTKYNLQNYKIKSSNNFEAIKITKCNPQNYKMQSSNDFEAIKITKYNPQIILKQMTNTWTTGGSE